MCIMIFLCKVGGLGLFKRGVLGLWLIMVYLYYDVALQGVRVRVV
jgi:hypothetical protein